MDWIHCNECYIQPSSQERRRFFLTNCGHVFCAQCSAACGDKCKVCQSPCRMIPLTSKMKPDVEVFFTNPMELARRCLESFTTAVTKMQTVNDFQKGHRQRLHDHACSEVRSLQQQLRASSQLEARCRQLQQRCQQLEEQLAAHVQQQRSQSRGGGARRDSPGFLSGMVSSRPLVRDSPRTGGSPAAGAAPDNPYMDVVRRTRPFELGAAGDAAGSPMTISPQQRPAGRPTTSVLARLFASPAHHSPRNNI